MLVYAIQPDGETGAQVDLWIVKVITNAKDASVL